MAGMSELHPDQIYRLITDYEALQDGFADRIEDLNVPLTEVDVAGELTRGNTQKLLVKSDAPWARQFGWESLGKMLKGTGLALALIIDDERFAPIKAEMAQRKMRSRPANAGSKRPTWLFTKRKAREMGRKRMSIMTPAQRQRLARKAGKASAKARRQKRIVCLPISAVPPVATAWPTPVPAQPLHRSPAPNGA
jgi:hypothetical protein